MEGGYEMGGGISCAVDLFYSREDPVAGGQERQMIGAIGLGVERGKKLLEQVQPGRRYTVRSFDMS